MSNRAIIAVALVPLVIYFAIMIAVLAMNPYHFPGMAMAGGGSVLAMLSVSFANFLRLRRDRKPNS